MLKVFSLSLGPRDFEGFLFLFFFIEIVCYVYFLVKSYIFNLLVVVYVDDDS